MTRFWADTGGSPAMEYALVGTLIAVVIVAAVSEIGEKVLGLFNQIHF